MDEKQKLPKEDLINFFVEHLKNRKLERLEKKRLAIKKRFSLGEEIFSSIVHGVGALLAIAALVLLVVFAEGAKADVGVIIFSSSAILLYTMSTLYHAFPSGRTKEVFERLDHSFIYLLIAGTYTPFCFLVFEGAKGWVFFGVHWTLAIIGIILKSIWIDRFELLHLILYILMGWSIILLLNDLISKLGTSGLILVVIGVLSYSIGTLFYIFSWFKFHHAIWHIFILIGTILHFFTMLFYVI